MCYFCPPSFCQHATNLKVTFCCLPNFFGRILEQELVFQKAFLSTLKSAFIPPRRDWYTNTCFSILFIFIKNLVLSCLIWKEAFTKSRIKCLLRKIKYTKPFTHKHKTRIKMLASDLLFTYAILCPIVSFAREVSRRRRIVYRSLVYWMLVKNGAQKVSEYKLSIISKMLD